MNRLWNGARSPSPHRRGKGFFRRQEVQDLIAVTRAIADSRDTLALGALIRGPLVGLTEERIADEIEGATGPSARRGPPQPVDRSGADRQRCASANPHRAAKFGTQGPAEHALSSACGGR